jgi:serine/threonine-protein kinase
VSPTIDIGSTLAAYTLTELIAAEGMGVLYRGEHATTGATVAVKVLSPELAGDETARKRFLREARYTSSLSHPNIVKVFDAGEVKKVLYIAMQYVDGADLAKVLEEEGALEPERTIDVLSQAGAALDAAHAAGIVHRDVKPSNVMIASGNGGEAAGHVYVTDFGLSRNLAENDGLTQPGTFVGNVLYSAPEQVAGQELDRRADVYALGCMLFHCLVGEHPFVYERALEVMQAHLGEPPPTASDRRPDLPPAIDAVIAKAMAKERDERYDTCATLIDAARVALGTPAPSDPSAGAPPQLVLEVTTGEGSGARLQLDGELVLGREAGGPGSLSGDSEISRRHARVVRLPSGVVQIEDLGSSNGTLVNDQPISTPTTVTAGDRVQLGDTLLVVREQRAVVSEPGPAPSETAPDAPADFEAPTEPELGSRFVVTLEVDLDAREVVVRLGGQERVISFAPDGEQGDADEA